MNNNQVKAIRDLWAGVTKKTEADALEDEIRALAGDMAAEIRDNEAELAELRAAEERRRKAWELTEMVNVPGLGKVTIAALRWAFEQVEDKANWKRPICAEVLGHRVLLTLGAIEFFQADAPSVSWVKDRVVTPTYDDLQVRAFRPFYICSKGYQAY